MRSLSQGERERSRQGREGAEDCEGAWSRGMAQGQDRWSIVWMEHGPDGWLKGQTGGARTR